MQDLITGLEFKPGLPWVSKSMLCLTVLHPSVKDSASSGRRGLNQLRQEEVNRGICEQGLVAELSISGPTI